MTLRNRILLFFVTGLLLLTGCASQPLPSVSQPEVPPDLSTQPPPPEEGKVIPFTLAVYPRESFHPALSKNRTNLLLSSLLYQPLYRLDGSFEPQPVLASGAAVSEDKLTWTIFLKNAAFSDGTPLTGKIAADALNTARGENSRYAARLAGIAGVTPGEGSVTITLSSPNGNLPALLDVPIALGDGERPLGTGPYILQELDEILSLHAAEGAKVPAQDIPLHAIAQTDDLIAAFDSGDVTLVETDLMGTNTPAYSGNYEVWDYPSLGLVYLGLNTREGRPCVSDGLRRGLAKSIDRESIADTVFAGHAVPTALPLHPNSPRWSKEVNDAWSYQPEALSGELVLLVNSENSTKAAAAQHIADQLRAVGLGVEVRRLPWESYMEALENGDFDLYLAETNLTADFDLRAILGTDGALNYGGWSSLITDQLLAELNAGLGEPEVVYSHLMDQAVFIPICFKNGSVLTQWGRVSGLDPVREDPFYQMENWIIN